MPLTPLEIKQQEFATSMRGWNPEEVRNFLSLVASEWEHLCEENREMKKQMKKLSEKVEHYEQLEDSLHETLQDVRASAQNRIERAQSQADHTLEKARLQAANIINQAEQKRGQIHGEMVGLLGKRAEIIGSIRAYLQASLDSLEQFEGNPANRYHKPQSSLPAEANIPSARQIDALVDDLE
jgi:cell division initiation protein